MALSPLVRYITSHQSVLIHTDFARELWMIPDRLMASHKSEADNETWFTIKTLSPLYIGQLFVYETKFWSVQYFNRVDNRDTEEKTYQVIGGWTDIPFNPKNTKPLCTPQDRFILEPGVIANYPEGPPIETTIGIFVANYLFYVYPFGDYIPYHNDTISIKTLEKAISIPILKGDVSISAVKDKYINTLSLFGNSTEMICPNITEKTITVPKHIAELRETLVKQNKEALEAGDATVMSDIEQTLISAYKDYLQGDPSLHFLLKPKYFKVVLKKLLLTQGMVEKFGEPGKFTFVAQPMGSGWKVEDLPTIFNEVRQGSYARAIETADGGVIAKLILRVLQDTRIVIDDCGTTRGEDVEATKDVLQDFEWNYVINKDGTNSLIDAASMPSFLGKQITIRTPGYCQATKGFCAKCFGKLFEDLGQKALAPVANDFARNITTSALKSMHGKSHSTADVSNIDRYVIQ